MKNKGASKRATKDIISAFALKAAGAVFAAVLLICLAACAKTETPKPRPEQTAGGEKKLKIVTTIFPEYDWTKQILGEKADDAELVMLLDKGVDLHSFQPAAGDILKISDCDLFIYVGGESDEWAEDAVAEAKNKDMRVINLMDVMGDSAKAEEVKEGMEAEEEEAGEEEEEEIEYDEHVWLSLKNAKLFCGKIADELCEIDPKNAETYRKNLDKYTEQLDGLDAEIKELAQNSQNKTLIFGDRFPFRYFTDDYGFDYYAAFVGCSAETEASFETIVFLASKYDELGKGTVYTTESSDGKIAKAVIENSKTKDGKTVALDSMQSVTGAQVEEGAAYLSIMQKNYEALKRTLNETE